MLIQGLELYLTIPLVMALGISINVFFTLMKLNWANTSAQRSVALLLPLIILIITKVISLNLALALGMIGALSIVRFRTPVRSPFELVTFFSFIAIGIAAVVDYRYALVIWLATILTPVGNMIIAKISPNNFSSSEGNISERSLATFRVIGANGKSDLMQVVKRNESGLHSFYESEESTNADNVIEIAFAVDSVESYRIIEEELRKCSNVISSALQKY